MSMTKNRGGNLPSNVSLFEELLSHPDVSWIENQVFLKSEEPLLPEEIRLLERLEVHPGAFQPSTQKPLYWIRIRDSSSKQKLGDFHFFEPGCAYRSDIVQMTLQIVQRNRRYRKAQVIEDPAIAWDRYAIWYLAWVSAMIFIFAMVRYFSSNESGLRNQDALGNL